MNAPFLNFDSIIDEKTIISEKVVRKMNYLKEINAFHNQQETNPLSSAAANLWHVMMSVNNRAGWIKQFTVAVSVLCVKAALSESAFKRARIELQEKGYIRYQSRGGNRAALYEMITLALPEQMKDAASGQEMVNHKLDDKVSDNPDRNLDHNLDRNVSALYKQNETKQEKRTTTTAWAFFSENFGKINSYIGNEMDQWITSAGDALVLTAMQRALERGKENWGYVKGILQAWDKKGITSVEDAMREETYFRERRQGGRHVSQQKEVIPDWFWKQKQEQGKSSVQDDVGDGTLTADQQKVAALLLQYGG
jgi:DnaD/phage-associated family protein